jgi:hypothetical protein
MIDYQIQFPLKTSELPTCHILFKDKKEDGTPVAVYCIKKKEKKTGEQTA